MFASVSMRLHMLVLLLAVSLDVLFVTLGWTWPAAILTALLVGPPLACLVLLAREAVECCGVELRETGSGRASRLPDDTPPGKSNSLDPGRSVSSRRIPAIAATASRAAVLLLIAASAVTLRTVLAFRALPQ